MTPNVILWITTIIMLVGGLSILMIGKRRTPLEGLQTALHGIVPIIAACSYLAMATGQGLISLPTGAAEATGGATRVFYFARYIDWSVTTPLLLISLGMTAMHSSRKSAAMLVGAVLADVIMIVTAFAFGASEVPWMKWTWFIVSCAAFLGVYYVIWIPQMQANARERDDIRSMYRRDASILSIIWLLYPVILAVDPDGLDVVSETFGVLVIAVLDVLAKVMYGFMTVTSDTKAADRDLAEQELNQKVPLAAHDSGRR